MINRTEPDAKGGDALSLRQTSETMKRLRTALNNFGALLTPQPSLLLSLPVEIRLQIWEEATYVPSSIVIPIYSGYHGRRQPYDHTVCLRPLPTSYQNTLCRSRHALDPFAPRTTNPRAWLFTCRQIYAEASPLIDIHPPSLHFCDAIAMRNYLKLAVSPFSAAASVPKPQELRSLSLCLYVGVKAVGSGRYGLAMSWETGWEGGHGDEFCDMGCMYCSSVRGMPTDLEACFPELRKLKISIRFKCVPEKTEEMIAKGRKTMEEERADDPSMYENRTYMKSMENIMGKSTVKSMGTNSAGEKSTTSVRQLLRNTLFRRILRNKSDGGGQEEVGKFVDDDERVEWIVEWICKQRPLWGFVGKRLDSVEVVFKTGIVHDVRSHQQPVDGCWCAGKEVGEQDEMRGRLERAIKRTLMKGKLRDEPGIKPRGYPF